MKDLRERIEALKKISLDLDLLTEDVDEEEILNDLEGAIDEARFFYEEKLEKLEACKRDPGYEYQMGIRENVI